MQLLPRPQKQSNKIGNLRQQQTFKQPYLPNNEEINIGDRSQERVAVFINSSSLFAAATRLNIEIDYNKLLSCLTKKRKLLRAYFYIATDFTNRKQQIFIHQMRHQGYRVIAKELIQRSDGSKKANLDVEIAVDMLTISKYCDALVLLGADEELMYAVNTVSYKGIQVEVVNLGILNDEILSVADCYTDIETIKHEFAKKRVR